MKHIVYYSLSCLICEGLQFLRLIHLLDTPELLQLLHIIKTNRQIRVVKVMTVMFIVWMLGTSMYFLVSASLLQCHRNYCRALIAEITRNAVSVQLLCSILHYNVLSLTF